LEVSQISNMLLQLLSTTTSTTDRNLEVQGRIYRLIREEIDETNPAPYTAVSYAWGEGIENDPLHPEHQISSRTIPVLKACVQQRDAQTRFWVDAFCVHLKPELKRRDLESMGFIYNAAAEVIVVLSSGASDVLKEMDASHGLEWKGLSDSALQKLEGEEWISRAWTYQEIVNQNQIYFTCEDATDALVKGSQFLNALGQSLSLLRKRGSNLSDLPRLNAFEDAIADWRVADYCGRSALQVMANMDKRVQKRPEDHFYAMIGAVTTTPASEIGHDVAAEAFMVACETKQDFSFIYSAAQRNAVKGKRWRPEAGEHIPPILSWQCAGDGQPGHFDTDALVLEKMAVLQTEPLQLAGTQFLNQWLSRVGHITDFRTGTDLSNSAFSYLKTIGFRGSICCLSLSCGFFFPYTCLSESLLCSVYVSTTIFWVFGAPGIACVVDSEGEAEYCPGIFVGDARSIARVDVRLQ
jgi:hypothetical protein